MAKQRQARKCKARRTNGQLCGNWAMNGSTVCHAHGGKAPQVRAAAQENLITARAERLLHRADAAPCTDPLEALQRLAGRALALEEAIGRLVNDLGSIRYESGGDSEFGSGGGEQLRAEVGVLERAMDRCGRLLVDIARLNIDERLARVTERQTEIMQAALTATLGEMGFEAPQQAEARKRLARHLRAV